MRGICHFSKSIFLFLYLLHLSKYIEMAKTLNFHHSRQDENREKSLRIVTLKGAGSSGEAARQPGDFLNLLVVAG